MSKIPAPVLLGGGLLLGGFTAAAAGLLSKSTKSRSDWLSSFTTWGGPASDTQDEKVSRSDRLVRDALTGSHHLAGFEVKFIAHGSSVNNTNTKLTSDLDMIVMLDEQWQIGKSGSSTRSFKDEYADFRRRVWRALSDGFGWWPLSEGKKCLKVTGNDTRVPCDVLPAFRLRKYWNSGTSYLDGVVFLDTSGIQIVSFPEQHLENGRAKNVATGFRYKQVIRILKNLKADFVDNPSNLLFVEPVPSSFEIECVVSNVPDKILKQGDLYDATRGTLTWIASALTTPSGSNPILTVSRAERLFSQWSAGGATLLMAAPTQMPAEVDRFQKFVRRALSEIGVGS